MIKVIPDIIQSIALWAAILSAPAIARALYEAWAKPEQERWSA